MCNGKVYVFGGAVGDRTLLTSTIECLDLSVSPLQWVVMEHRLVTPRTGCTSVVAGTQIYVLGGYSEDSDYLLTVEVLDTETGVVTPGPTMPRGRAHIGAMVDGNELYVFSTGGIHRLKLNQPNATWEKISTTNPFRLIDNCK
jgi:N-acetylneuraminic acid mutarotase